MAAAAPLQAEDLGRTWYWHAFGSQAAIYTSDNNFFGDTDDSVSTEYRELGLILGAQPFKDLSLVAQLLSREAGDSQESVLQFDYAFASYDLYTGLDGHLAIKAGRLRSPLGFYNATRDAPHTRPGILLPHSVYPEKTRDFYYSRDGVQLSGGYQSGLSSLNWDLVYARLSAREEDYPKLFGMESMPGEVDTPFTPLARLIWDWDMGRVRLGVTWADFSYGYEAGPVDFMATSEISASSWIYSAEYNTADWSLSAEYSSYKVDFRDLLPGFPESMVKFGGYGYYLQGTYRFTPSWDGFVRWDAGFANEDNRRDPSLFTKTVATGVSWRPDSHWLLRTEWHVIEGTSILPVEKNRPEDLETHWHMVLFQVSYRF